MAETVIVSFLVVLVFCGALAVGQFFGREPITPKCNPGTCCMKGKNCGHRAEEARKED